jgi:hypothetical protein
MKADLTTFPILTALLKSTPALLPPIISMSLTRNDKGI